MVVHWDAQMVAPMDSPKVVLRGDLMVPQWSFLLVPKWVVLMDIPSARQLDFHLAHWLVGQMDNHLVAP